MPLTFNAEIKAKPNKDGSGKCQMALGRSVIFVHHSNPQNASPADL
jgi:hypothetical protein